MKRAAQLEEYINWPVLKYVYQRMFTQKDIYEKLKDATTSRDKFNSLSLALIDLMLEV